jgi:hypothetical protein
MAEDDENDPGQLDLSRTIGCGHRSTLIILFLLPLWHRSGSVGLSASILFASIKALPLLICLCFHIMNLFGAALTPFFLIN